VVIEQVNDVVSVAAPVDRIKAARERAEKLLENLT
jgi:hypothetical protein